MVGATSDSRTQRAISDPSMDGDGVRFAAPITLTRPDSAVRLMAIGGTPENIIVSVHEGEQYIDTLSLAQYLQNDPYVTQDLLPGILPQVTDRLRGNVPEADASYEEAPVSDDTLQHIGPYQLVRRIHRTESVSVYEGRNRRLNRTVAVKVFKPNPKQSQDEQWEEAERWRRVMTAVSELANPPRTHAHLARVSDLRTFMETPDGLRHYAVMELLGGASLHAYFKERSSLSLEALADIALQIASALDSLYGAGVAHGKVVPENLLFDGRESTNLKLVGFGMHSVPLDVEPEAAGKDRHDLAAMLKEAITTHGLNKPLPVAAKTVLVRALEPEKGYPYASEFARAFQQALNVEERAIDEAMNR